MPGFPGRAQSKTGCTRPTSLEFRTDLERIRFATAFSRLADVTQVVTSMATGGVVHNRLTHTIKVTAVARAIAVRLIHTQDHALLHDLGGLDHVVIQAAATAHDLGHPPFGHLGERVLDRLARERFGLADGFEGNAQTFRVLTELEVLGPGDQGLNLTAATLAAVLKYPWACFYYPDPHPTDWPIPPRGAGRSRSKEQRSSRPTSSICRKCLMHLLHSRGSRRDGRPWSARSWISPTTSRTRCTT